MKIVLGRGGAGLGGGFEIRVPRTRPAERDDRIGERVKGVDTMSIEEQGKGKSEEAKGRIEQAAGDLTGDNETKAHGMLDEAKGKLRQGVDKAREAIHDATAKD